MPRLIGRMHCKRMNIKHKTSFTIFEVLVASVVVSIIMLGVITTSISLSNSARYYSGSYYVAQNTQTTLNHILGQAALASGTPTQPGIIGVSSYQVYVLNGATGLWNLQSDPGSGNVDTFCFYQNINFNNSNQTGGPGDNRWSCYTYSGYKIYWCLKSYDFLRPPGSSAWNASSQPGACIPSDVGYKQIGSSKERPTTIVSINSNLGTSKALFQVSINNCLDPTKVASCVAGDTNNPYVTKTGSISPPGINS